MDISTRLRFNAPLAAILLVGVAVRFWGISFGLPYTAAPDEPTHFLIGLRIFKNGDLHPHWLNYPSLMFYLNALALIPYYFVNKAFGIFQSPADIPYPEIVTMGVGYLQAPSEFLLSRGLSALLGAASIYLVYRVAQDLIPIPLAPFPLSQRNAGRGGRGLGVRGEVALLAALFLAISPAHVNLSHLIRPDVYAVFFALVTFFFAQRILRDPRPHNYFLAAVGAGLSISSKYNMPLIVIPIAAAHFIHFGMEGWRRKEIYLAALVSGVTFFATSPYVLLDFPLFQAGFGFEVYSQGIGGHAGTEGNTFRWYLNFLATSEGAIALAALAQAVRILWTRTKEGLFLLAFPLTYFLFINQFIVRNDRTILPMLPFVHLLAAIFLVDLAAWIANRARLPRRAALAVSLALAALMAFVPATQTLAANTRLMQADARDSARVWLVANLPAGTRIATEAYTPYLDTRQYVLYGIDALVDREPDWYAEQGFEYLVASSGMYGRFYAEPERYAEWIDQYDQIFDRYPGIKRFSENGYEIRVFKTGVVLPSRRVAARFGDYGDIIELIGYEPSAPNAGKPIQVKLYWRPLRAAPEPLELETRLFGQTDDEIAKARMDLFQGKGWQNGLFVVEWTIPLPADAPRGPYRLQLNVIQTRFAYSVPAQSWAGERIDPLVFGLGD